MRGWVWPGAVNQEILANAREVGVKQPLTTTHGYKINLPGCRTDARIFFALRVIHPWNSLKLTPASMSSLYHFKALQSLGMQNCPDFYIAPNPIIK